MKALNEDPVVASHSSVGEQMGSAGTIFSTDSIKGKWHSLQSVVCISQESHINLHVTVCMQKTWFHGVEEVKKSIYFMVLQGTDRWILSFPEALSEAAHRGNWIFSLGVGTPIIIIFIISSMNTRGTAALHQYSCLMCWCPAIIKFKASAPLSKSHTDVAVQVTLVSRCPLEVSAVQTKRRMGCGR